MLRSFGLCRLLPLLILPTLAIAVTPAPPAPTATESLAGTDGEELEAPAVRPEVLAAHQAMQSAVDAVKQRETELLKTNEVLRAIVARRDQTSAKLDELIRNLPEMLEKEASIALAEKELAGIQADPTATAEDGQPKVREAKRKLLGLRKELNQLKFGGTLETAEIRQLRGQVSDALQEMNLGLRKDARYAELRRKLNLAHLEYQRVALPLPKMPEAAVQKALEDAQAKPVESAPITPKISTPPVPAKSDSSPPPGPVTAPSP